MQRTSSATVLRLAQELGGLTRRDLIERSMNPDHLPRLVRRGLLNRSARGFYVPIETAPSENRSLVEAVRLHPKTVVCLLSALRFHGLTTQSPREVWLALDAKAWAPTRNGPPIRWVRYSRESFREGVELHRLEDVAVPVYSAAKTVADCFKFRGKIGTDVALEALRDYRRGHGNLDELWRFAKVCRVANVMRPYLESVG